ncbi:DsbA family protein [Terasakiella sp. A23]|uniref:DsbA family protein n=1 Tax=Terasakiella sp. FCG-A23 TaxID=3080561 RepID=UPI0029549ECC|nr:DsbA family protein [Terasakiella sp. A23]MDV7339406.1 DsbA family protein [Terasakiella sp. A23]
MRFLIIAFSLFLFSQPVLADDKLSADQQDEVRKLVRDTLLANPEILMEAMEVLQARQEQARADMQKSTMASLDQTLITPEITPVGGNPKGDVTIVEFFDYQCGYCKRVFPDVMKVVNDDANIRYVFKELAVLGETSEFAAHVALATQLQGKYTDFHSAMMKVKGRLTNTKILKTAESLGVDMDQLQKDMVSERVQKEIASTKQLARNLNIQGTPGFIIGDQIFRGAIPADAMVEAVKQARKQS